MQLKNSTDRYGAVAKTFHWLLFLLLLGAIIGGNIESRMDDGPEKMEMVALHKSFGVIILTLVILRLAWRLISPPPKNLASGWQAPASVAVHWLLYAVMFAQPVTGMLMSQAAGYPVALFGVFEVPALVAESEALAEQLHEAHERIWILLAVFALLHIAAGLHHHFVQKDDVLRRMGYGQLDGD